MFEPYISRWEPTPAAPSSLDDVYKATREAAEKVDNLSAYQRNMEEAYDRRNDAIAAAGGPKLTNPWRSIPSPEDQARIRLLSEKGSVYAPQYMADKYDRDLQDLEAANPNLAHAIQSARPPSLEVREAMTAAETKRAAVMQSRGMIDGRDIPLVGSVPLVGSFVAGGVNLAYQPSSMAMMLAGSVRGQLSSPGDIMAMAFGPLGTSPAKSLIRNAVRNAANNAGGQALIEPMVQTSRAAVGLESGLSQSLENIAGAAGIGAALDFGIRAPVRALRRSAGATDLGGVFTDVAPDLPPVPKASPRIDPDVMTKAEAGDVGALRTLAEQTGAIDDPAVKGAIDHAELSGDFEGALTRLKEEMRTKGGVEIDTGETHAAVVKALRSTLDGDPMPVRAPEPVRVAAKGLQLDVVERLVSERAGELDRLMTHTAQALDRQDQRLVQMVNDAFEAGLPNIVEILSRAADAVAEGRSARKIGRDVAAQVQAEIERLGFDRFTDMVALHSGRGSVVEVAQAMRRSPELVDTNVSLRTEPMQLARSIAALDDVSFDMVARGEADPRVAAYVADHVDPGRQAGVLDLLGKTGTRDLADVAEMVRVLEPGPRLDPAPKGLDDPAGPEAKALTEQMETRLAPDVKAAREAVPEIPEVPGEGLAGSLVREIMMTAAVRRGTEAKAAILDAIKLAQRILPEGTKLELADGELRSPKGKLLDAMSDTTTGDIILASYALNPAGRIGHEGVHTLATRGLLSPGEVKLLAEAAAKLPDVFDETRRTEYADAYKDRPNLDALLDEEAAAHLIEAVINKKVDGITPEVTGLVERLRKFFDDMAERLKNWREGKGWQTADDLIRDILNGEAAKRQAVQNWMRKQDLTAVAVREPEVAAPEPDAMFALADKVKQEVMQRGQAMFAFAGERAKTADLDALSRAKEMDAANTPREQIWTDTGWFKGVDGRWRFEIDDSGASINQGSGRAYSSKAFNHPEMAAAYPSGKVKAYVYTNAPEERGGFRRGGWFTPAEILAAGPNAHSAKSTALHEAQHDIQRREGFAAGANYKDTSLDDLQAAKDYAEKTISLLGYSPTEARETGRAHAYMRHAGEVEARAVQERMDLTADQRRARPPWLDYDVPEDQQIVRFANGSSASMLPYSAEPPVDGPAMKGEAMFAIRAFHGSPHSFDKFDISKIGTGEGAQAYGAGLYFAESEGVARHYRNALGSQKLKDGTPWDEYNPAHWAADAISRANGDRAEAASLLAKEMTPDMKTKEGAHYQRLLRAKGMIERGEPVPELANGRLYEVRINAEPDDFLDWDKPLSQQSEKVQQAARKYMNLADGSKMSEIGWRNISNRPISEAIGDSLRSNTAGLREAGIAGIRYLDQGSRTAGDGSRNYVVFDDSLIEITAVDGKPIESAERQSIVDGMSGRDPATANDNPPEPQSPLVAALHDADMAIEVAAALKPKPDTDGAMFALRDPNAVVDELQAKSIIGETEAAAIKAKLDQLQKGGLSLDQAIAAVAQTLEAEGQDKKRRALMMETVRQTILDDLLKYRNAKGETDILEAYKRMHERFDTTGSYIKDIETAKDAIIVRAQMQMQSLLKDARKGAITGDLRRRYGQTRARMDNVVRELFGTATDDAAAKEFATAWTATAEELRTRFNAAGGAVGKLEKWGLPQGHDALALLDFGKIAWTDYMMTDGVLDRARMVDQFTQRRLTDAELREALGTAWDRITTDGWADRELTGVPMGRGALFKQHADHRFLHFKDADAWLAYARKFGNPDPYAAMMNHIAMMARDIAHMERFGPNPTVMRTYLRNWLTQKAETLVSVDRVIAEQTAELKRLQGSLSQPNPDFEAMTDRLGQVHTELASIRSMNGMLLKGSIYTRRNKARLEALQAELLEIENKLTPYWTGDKPQTIDDAMVAAQITALLDDMRTPVAFAKVNGRPGDYLNVMMDRVDSMWEQQRGNLGVPVHSRTASALATFRNFIVSTSLGSAVISSLSDPAFGQAQRQRWGMGFGRSNAASVMRQTFARLFNASSKWEALASGIALDAAMNVMHQQARIGGGIDARSWSGYVADRVLSIGLLSPYTQAGKHSHGLMLQMYLGEHTGLAWKALPAEIKNGLTAHGFDAAAWDKIRSAQLYDPEAKAMAGPDARVKQLRAGEIEAAVGRELAERYIAMIVRDTRMAVPESTVESRSMVLGRTRAGTVSGEIVRAFGQFKGFPIAIATLHMGQAAREIGAGKPGAAARAGALLITSTMLGTLAMALKDMKDGRDPRRWLDENTWLAGDMWMAAMLQSGGLGIYGDFFFSNVNRQGNGLAATLGGPMVDRADNIKNLTIGNIAQLLQGKDTNFGREASRFVRTNTPGGNLFFWSLAYQRILMDQLQRTIDPKAAEAFRTQILNRRRDYGGQEYFWRPGEKWWDRGPDVTRVLATR